MCLPSHLASLLLVGANLILVLSDRRVAAEWADAERMTRNELERLHAELAAARVEQQKLKTLNAVLQKQNAELAAWQPAQMFSAGEMMLLGINR